MDPASHVDGALGFLAIAAFVAGLWMGAVSHQLSRGGDVEAALFGGKVTMALFAVAVACAFGAILTFTGTPQ